MIKFSRPLSITLYKRILPLEMAGAILLLNASLWKRDRKSNNDIHIDRYHFIRSNKTFWPCSQCWYSVKVGSAICPDWRLLSGRVLLCLDNQTWSKVVITEPDWSKLGRTPALDWGADWHGEGGRAHQRDAADPRGVWCYLRPFVQTTPEVEQTGAAEDWTDDTI